MRRFYLYLSCLILLAAFSPAYNLTRPDNIAVDKTAQYYRAQGIDPALERLPSAVQKGISSDPDKYLPLLVDYFRKNAKDDYHLVKMFHDWITLNIAYDTDKFYGWGKGSNKPYELLTLGRTTCGGFASLFVEMCRLSGIEALYISGKSRNYVNSSDEVSGHAWSAVRLNNTWYIVDVTSDNRFGYKNRKFSEKSDYNTRSLFITPRAKLIDNYADNPEYILVDDPGTLEDFLARPLFHMNILDYPGITFTNLEKYRIKYSYNETGAGVTRNFDAIQTDKGVVRLELDCPSNILVSTALYDEAGKRYDYNSISYSAGGRTYCEFTAPAPGVYNASIRAQYLDRDDSVHGIYSFKVVSRKGSGPPLPREKTITLNNRFNFHGLKILDHNLDTMDKDGYLMLTVHHPRDISLYVTLYDLQGNDHRKDFTIDTGPDFRTYYICLPDTRTYQFKMYSRPLALTNESHQAAGYLNIRSKSPQAATPPPLTLIRYSAFHENHIQLLGSDLTNTQSRMWTITLSSPHRGMLSCALKDKDNQSMTGYFIYNREKDQYSFSFSTPPKKGMYTARIYYIDEQGKYSSLCYFMINSDGTPGPVLPLDATLYTQNDSFIYNTRLLTHNIPLAAQTGYFSFELPVQKDVSYYLGLYDLQGNKFNDRVSTSYETHKVRFTINPPDSKYYYAKLYMKYISTDKNYNKLLYLMGIDGFNSKYQSPVPPYQLVKRQNFNEYGLSILEENISSMPQKGKAIIKIQSPENVELTINLKDEAKNNLKDFAIKSVDKNIWTLEFKKPPRGVHTAYVFARFKGEKSYQSVMYFMIE